MVTCNHKVRMVELTAVSYCFDGGHPTGPEDRNITGITLYWFPIVRLGQVLDAE